MRDQAFCLFGLLHGGPARLSEVIAMVPQPRRAELERIACEFTPLPEGELRNRLASLRREEKEETRRDAARRTGLRLDEFPPRLQHWLIVSHGRENH